MTQPPHKDAILAAAIFHKSYVAFSATYEGLNRTNAFYETELTDMERQAVNNTLDLIENAPQDYAVALKYGLQREISKFTDAFMEGKTTNT